MGIRMGGGRSISSHYSSSPSWAEKPSKAPNPDPLKFKILRTAIIGSYTILEVQYEGCTNFEGKKILVFENIDAEYLHKLTALDPHFFDSKDCVSPIARFMPTPRGWDMALIFCRRMES